MAEQLLNGADVVTVFEQVSGERVAERVAAGGLADFGLTESLLDRALDDGLVQMMAATLAADAVHIMTRGGEDPLPAELAPGVRILSRERIGEGHPAGAVLQIGAVLAADDVELLEQAWSGGRRETGLFPSKLPRTRTPPRFSCLSGRRTGASGGAPPGGSGNRCARAG